MPYRSKVNPRALLQNLDVSIIPKPGYTIRIGRPETGKRIYRIDSTHHYNYDESHLSLVYIGDSISMEGKPFHPGADTTIVAGLVAGAEGVEIWDLDQFEYRGICASDFVIGSPKFKEAEAEAVLKEQLEKWRKKEKVELGKLALALAILLEKKL